MKRSQKIVHALDVDNCLNDLKHDLGKATAVLGAVPYTRDGDDVRILTMMAAAAVAHASEVLLGLRDLIERGDQ